MSVPPDESRRRLGDALRHAFAVDPPGPAEPTPEQAAPIDRICRTIARRHLATPGLMMLEMTRPLGFIGSQMMHVLEPAIWAIAREGTAEQYRQVASFLERRGAIDYICGRIEHFEKELRQGGASPSPGETASPPEQQGDP